MYGTAWHAAARTRRSKYRQRAQAVPFPSTAPTWAGDSSLHRAACTTSPCIAVEHRPACSLYRSFNVRACTSNYDVRSDPAVGRLSVACRMLHTVRPARKTMSGGCVRVHCHHRPQVDVIELVWLVVARTDLQPATRHGRVRSCSARTKALRHSKCCAPLGVRTIALVCHSRFGTRARRVIASGNPYRVRAPISLLSLAADPCLADASESLSRRLTLLQACLVPCL